MTPACGDPAQAPTALPSEFKGRKGTLTMSIPATGKVIRGLGPFSADFSTDRDWQDFGHVFIHSTQVSLDVEPACIKIRYQGSNRVIDHLASPF